MTDRISLLIQAKNLSAAQFADEIGVQRSSISHLMSGRNKPSLDLIQKTLQRFPEVSSEWLLFGKGEMVRELNLFDAQARSSGSDYKEEPAFGNEEIRQNDLLKQNTTKGDNRNVPELKVEMLPLKENTDDNFKAPVLNKEEEPMYVHSQAGVAFKNEIPKRTNSENSKKTGSINQIIVLYDDHTFTAYSPGN
jgi:transcriptional regulator with XRE-family HTH domain